MRTRAPRSWFAWIAWIAWIAPALVGGGAARAQGTPVEHVYEVVVTVADAPNRNARLAFALTNGDTLPNNHATVEDLATDGVDTGGVQGGGGGRRRRTKRPEFVARPSELGALLADLRKAKGLSLREVEEATGKAVSNAYLSQLENGRIQKPSPNVLHSLSEVYAVPYEALMEKAGYLLPSQDSSGRRRRLAAFAIDDLTAEEEEELLKYLAFLRTRRSS